MNAPIRIEANDLALLWQLSARARDARSEATLGFTIVNETLALIPYRQAAWWRAGTHGFGAVAALSGVPQSDPGAPYVQWLGEVFRVLARQRQQAQAEAAAFAAQAGAAQREAGNARRGDAHDVHEAARAAHGGAVHDEAHAAYADKAQASFAGGAQRAYADEAQRTARPSQAGAPRDARTASLALARPHPFTADDLPPELAADWPAWWPAHAFCVPLVDVTGHTSGAVAFAREQPFSPIEAAMLAELGAVWAHAFRTFAPRASLLERARGWLRPGRRRWRVLALCVAVIVFPVRLTVLAPGEVTAKDPFVVRAPLDGVIDHVDAQPNQRVAAGTPLFELDSTTLASRYAVANKNYDAAQEEYRQTAQLAVTEDKDRLDMALRKGKLDETAVERDYTARELARVRVAATRAGVAVFADANDWNGKAVSVGEKVMLLADPDHVELTAYVPVADNMDIKPGSTLTLYPKSSPLASYDARVDTVAWRAEPTPDGVLAYRVKASFDSGAHALPALGAMGTARIHGTWVPLVYYLLRRPLTVARQWLGW